MTNIIVAEEHQLRAIVHEEVSKLFQGRHEPKTEIDTMTLSAALSLLAEYGYILSKAKLYKLTASGSIPCRKFGQKLVFSRKDILSWAENQTKPKTGHLMAVGNAGYNWKEKVVGFLHDAAEDTVHTVDEIVQALKDKSNNVLKDDDALEIKEALNLLYANTALTREEYIARIKDSFLATKVKLNDLRHNMDVSRISNPTEKDMERTKRYRREYRQVLEYLGPVAWEWDEDEI